MSIINDGLTVVPRTLRGGWHVTVVILSPYCVILRTTQRPQYALLNTDFNLLTLPHVVNADLQCAGMAKVSERVQ